MIVEIKIKAEIYRLSLNIPQFFNTLAKLDKLFIIKCLMLGLKLKTDERWAELATSNLEALLTDHAFCEQKAASNAISLIIKYPHNSDLVEAMSTIAIEEMQHFSEVHKHITKRGWVLGKEHKDQYVNELLSFINREGTTETLLCDRLLFAAMVEARSCERFRLLSNNIPDLELQKWYYNLMISEANHYTTFINLAKMNCPNTYVQNRWAEWLNYEADVIVKYNKSCSMHG